MGAGEVIKGLEEGMQGMRQGEKRRIVIPPELAYGERGVQGLVPPDTALIYVVKLVKVIQEEQVREITEKAAYELYTRQERIAKQAREEEKKILSRLERKKRTCKIGGIKIRLKR